MKIIIRLISAMTAICLFVCSQADAQTIAEKKAGVQKGRPEMTPEMQKFLGQINREIIDWRNELNRQYAKVRELYASQATEGAYKDLLDRINHAKDHIAALEESWREMAVSEKQGEGYALWHQPETTLGQVVIDYGSQDFVYLVTPEIAAIKLSINSNIPIPRSSWSDMLELVLAENGVSVKQLNPFLRQLVLTKDDHSHIALITNNPQDLEFYRPDARVAFVISPEPAEVRRIWAFLDKFINPNTTLMQMIGRDILIVAPVADVQDLLRLYEFVASNQGTKEYKILPISKVDAEEMAKVLGTIFDQFVEDVRNTPGGNMPPGPRPAGPIGPGQPRSGPVASTTTKTPEVNGLRVIPLKNIAQAIFVIGTKEEIRKAEQIVAQVESQIGGAREKVIYRYTVKHSSADELGSVLEKIYNLMVATHTGYTDLRRGPLPPGIAQDNVAANTTHTEVKLSNPPPLLTPQQLYIDGYYQEGGYLVNPSPIRPIPNPKQKPTTKDRGNFIIDELSNMIIMVVEAETLPKIKELIRKLDVPKKMVQIEVLLFEKRLARETDYGLNLLKIGGVASQTQLTGATFNDIASSVLNAGAFNFFLSRTKNGAFPAFDLIYKFLLTQTDIQINASPSIVTLNQVPAILAVNEEISVNTGIFEVETVKGVTLKDSYTRAQYGITIEVTPTIHTPSEDDEECGAYQEAYVTLETDLTFDTIQPSVTDRPDVIRRHVTNQVNIPDGQTVIIGGLRRKIATDSKDSIPFIGELPGIGKLFSITNLNDTSSEMFLCITPKIIYEPCEQFEQIKWEEMQRRPGDIPDFLCILADAREWDKRRLLQGTMTILFGPELDRCWSTGFECGKPSPYASCPLCSTREYDGE